MAILKRKPVSFTDKFEKTLNWVEDQPFNFSKYVCELITKDMLEKEEKIEKKTIANNEKQDQENEKNKDVDSNTDNDNNNTSDMDNNVDDNEEIEVEDVDLDKDDINLWS